MKLRRKRIIRGAVLAFAIAGFTASTAQARPLSKWGTDPTGTSAAASYTPQQLRALELRSQGMNDRYVSATASYTPQQLRALELRSQGMNERYISAMAATPKLTPDQLRTLVMRFQGTNVGFGLTGSTSSTPVVSTSDGFNWGDAFVGAAATFGTAIVLVAAFTAIRRREQPLGV